MNSGALAGLIYNCPYGFNGQDVIAGVFFAVDLVLYIIFSAIFILRFVWFRKAAYEEIASSMVELTFMACWPISFMTLTTGVAVIISNTSWGGHPFSIVSYVMFWIVSLWDLLILLWAFISLIRRHEAYDNRMPFSIIIPAVSVATMAITGANVAVFAKDLSARLAIPMMILSFNWVGVGILLGIILYVYLFHSLLSQGWPSPDQTPTMFILVGPMGQSAAALQLLGMAANTKHRFADYNTGTFLTAEAAQGLDSACILVALLFNGLGVIWLFLGIYAMIERTLKKELRWTPSWNAIIFPNGTLATSFSVFALEMDSAAYKVITCILIIALVVVYFVNLFMTLLRIFQGKLLVVREDWRVRQQMEERQKEK